MDEHRGLARERKAVTRLPVIDLSPFVEDRGLDERRRVAKALREACIDIGFFYLTGHGIPQQEFDDVIAMGHRFFALPLAGIKLNLDMLDDCAAVLPQAGRAALARLQTLTEQALEQVRAVSHNLHPPDWQGLATGDALRYLVQSSGLMDRLVMEIDIQPLPVEPSHTVKIALYRCAQECISNVARHSGATHFALSLMAAGTTIELRMEDNGRGFPLEPSPRGKGIGLQSIREHTTALGGTCDVSSGPDGVGICVRLPLAAE